MSSRSVGKTSSSSATTKPAKTSPVSIRSSRRANHTASPRSTISKTCCSASSRTRNRRSPSYCRVAGDQPPIAPDRHAFPSITLFENRFTLPVDSQCADGRSLTTLLRNGCSRCAVPDVHVGSKPAVGLAAVVTAAHGLRSRRLKKGPKPSREDTGYAVVLASLAPSAFRCSAPRCSKDADLAHDPAAQKALPRLARPPPRVSLGRAGVELLSRVRAKTPACSAGAIGLDALDEANLDQLGEELAERRRLQAGHRRRELAN